MARTLIRGDSYSIRRPLYEITFVDDEAAPLDLTGCTIRSTYKITTTDPNEDTTDEGAYIKATLVVDTDGEAMTEDGLYLKSTADAGVVLHKMEASDTLALPLNTELYGDIELTDPNGEVFTWILEETITATDGYTNRGDS